MNKGCSAFTFMVNSKTVIVCITNFADGFIAMSECVCLVAVLKPRSFAHNHEATNGYVITGFGVIFL